MRSSGLLGSQSSLEPLPNLVAIRAPLGSVGSPVVIGGFLRVLQTLDGLSQVDTPLGEVAGPGFADSLAPSGPFSTGGIGSGESRENGAYFGGDGFSGDVVIIVILPLGSIFLPGLGCKGKLNRQDR